MNRSIAGLGVIIAAFVGIFILLTRRTASAVAAAARVPANGGHQAALILPGRVISSPPGIASSIASSFVQATPGILTSLINSFRPSPPTLDTSGSQYTDVSSFTGGNTDLSGLSLIASPPITSPMLDSGFGFSVQEQTSGSYT